MGPTVPAPLTRAAARRSALGSAGKSDVRARLIHVLALSGGAFAGALIMLGIGSLAGVPSIDYPSRAAANAEQTADPTPRPTPVARLQTAAPSAEVPAPEDTAAPVPPVTVAPIGVTEPETSAPEPSADPTEPAADESADEPSKGKSADAPGRNKQP
jgi:hypothetical protein